MSDDDSVNKARFAEQVAEMEAMEAEDPDRVPVVSSGHRGTRALTLYQPIKVDGKTLTRVTLRAPTGGDLDDWADGTIDSPRAMLARLAGLHPVVIKGLDSVDLQIVYQIFWDMVPAWMRDAAAQSEDGTDGGHGADADKASP